MRCEIEDGKRCHAQRDETVRDPKFPNVQGLNLFLDGLTVHFKDERDAVKLAMTILERTHSMAPC
jgi:hypothetical protein